LNNYQSELNYYNNNLTPEQKKNPYIIQDMKDLQNQIDAINNQQSNNPNSTPVNPSVPSVNQGVTTISGMYNLMYGNDANNLTNQNEVVAPYTKPTIPALYPGVLGGGGTLQDAPADWWGGMYGIKKENYYGSYDTTSYTGRDIQNIASALNGELNFRMSSGGGVV
jgi:hypothetical protein